jgi:hypothetical protein
MDYLARGLMYIGDKRIASCKSPRNSNIKLLGMENRSAQTILEVRKSRFYSTKGEIMNTRTLPTKLLSFLILASVIFLAACSSIGEAPVALAQSNPNEEQQSRSWEIDANDIAAAREAAETLSKVFANNDADYGENDFVRSWEIDISDIAAARQAAELLSRTFASSNVDYGDDGFVRILEINAEDIAAARLAAEVLSEIYPGYQTEYEDGDVVRYWEIGPEDIAAARAAALYLSNIMHRFND